MQNTLVKNNALDFTDTEWGQIIDGNGLLIMWFLEWNTTENAEPIMEFFAKKYQQSAGCDPWHMKDAKISLDGKFLSEGDDDLEPYFLVNTDDGVGYIYPYAFVALPKKSGGHHIVRMD